MPEKSLLILARGFQAVEDELIGGSVRIVRLTKPTLQQIADQNVQQIANWDLFYSGYQHAFVNTYNAGVKSDDEAEQEIVRAAIVLRIIQPYSSGLHLVLTAWGDAPKVLFQGHSRIGIGTNTYVSESDHSVRLTPEHIRKAKVLWPGIERVCVNWQEHRRILRAIRFFEIAYARRA